jgi:hypothetical protein
MRVLPLLLACLLVGCSSAGTESGNPTRSACGGATCACAESFTLQVTDATSGASIGTTVTIDGQSFACTETTTASVCSVPNAGFSAKGKQQIVVSAPGHEPTTATVDIPLDGECCACAAQSVTIDIALEPSP